MKFSITDIDGAGEMQKASALLLALAAAMGATAPTIPRGVISFPPLDAADNPAAGVDLEAPVAFGGNPVEAFGLPPVGAATASSPAASGHGFAAYESNSHGSPELDADAAKLEALAGPGAAGAAFGDLGNVVSAGSPATTAPEIVSTAPAPAPAAGVDVDKHGLPWDARIHASSKTKNADGAWRGKRGTDPAVIAQVENELRGIMALPSAPAAPNVPPPPPVAAPLPTGAPTASVGIPTAPAGASFVTVMTKVGELTAAGKLTDAEANSAILAVGLQSYPLLVNRPDLAQTVSDTLDAIVAAKG